MFRERTLILLALAAGLSLAFAVGKLRPKVAVGSPSSQVPDPARPVAVFVLNRDGDELRLAPADSGVRFDMDGTGAKTQMGWTRAGSQDGFLFLDRNANGVVDSGVELLGNGWRKPDGSRVTSGDDALWVIQGVLKRVPGPIPWELGRIGPSDEVFSRLRIWSDVNHDGRSDASELQTLAQAGVVEISKGFISLGRVVDSTNNMLLLRGTFVEIGNGARMSRQMIEVEFARVK